MDDDGVIWRGAWHGSRRLRQDILSQLRVMADAQAIQSITVAGASVDLFGRSCAPGVRWEEASSAIGWPADALALCDEVFYEGFLEDPPGIQQHVEGVLCYLEVPRPGADLRDLVPDFLAHRLEEPWRSQCSAEVSDVLDTVALMLLDGEEEPRVLAALATALTDSGARVSAVGPSPGSEPLHHELRALTWCRAVAQRRSEPGGVRVLGSCEQIDFAAPLPPVGVPFPPEHRAAERMLLADLREVLLSWLSTA